jgi:hypothetical protein
MNRYNIFHPIHKGLREILYNTASLLQQTDFCHEEEAVIAVNQVHDVMFLFDKHAHTEDNFILPAIETFEPTVATLFEEEHIQDHELSNRMRTLLHIFSHCTLPTEQQNAASAIRYAFTEFMIFNLQHMAKEETKLNALLWEYFSDDHLKNITQQIVAQVPPDAMAKYSQWMMKAMNNPEITGWLKEIKNSTPEFVFNSMMELAEKELPAGRWHTIRENMTEGAMLA